MSYTMTYDASHKVGRGGGHVRGFCRHVARDADLDAGFEFTHANPNVDPDRTHLNETFINDGEGGFRRLQSVDGRPPSAELEDYLDSRLATVKKPLRKDAVVLRPLILQLDPIWFDEHNGDWQENGLNEEAQRLTQEALAWTGQEFGRDNIVGHSLHLDETSPQLQVLVTPVTPDGRLAQKDFFKGPGDFRRQHHDLRSHMAEAGYDVKFSVSGRSQERLSSTEFGKKADEAKKVAAKLSVAESDGAKAYEDRLAAKADRKAAREALDAAEARADEIVSAATEEAGELRRRGRSEGHEEGRREAQVEAATDRTLAARLVGEAGQDADAARIARQAAQNLRDEAEADRAEAARQRRSLDELVATARLTPPEFERFLDRPRGEGKTFRPLYEAEVARSRKVRAQAQRDLAEPARSAVSWGRELG